MWAVVWRGPHEMVLEEVATATPSAGWVVVEPGATGICGSDVTAYKGLMGVSPPGTIRGHEFAGTVVDTTAADAAWLGATVTVNPLVACGHCRWCAAGFDNQCPDQRTLGILLPGSLAELVAVPVTNLVRMDPSVPMTAAAGAEPLAQALHDLELAGRDAPVESVLIVGAGSIGSLTVQVAVQRGIGRIDVLDPVAARREAALAAGATAAHDSPDAAADHAHDGYDAVLDMVGAPDTRRDALRWTRRGGTAVFVGLSSAEDTIDWRDAMRREVTVRGANASNASEFRQAAAWIDQGVLRPSGQERLARLDEAPAVFADLATGRSGPEKTYVSAKSATVS
jgi:2-desacetyl-2-hydroxyethyl bacteriochlorophyllide A dehydrogenase